MKAIIEISKALGLTALVLAIAFVIGFVGVAGMKYLMHEPAPIEYDNFYTMKIIFVQDVENIGPSEAEIRELQLICKAEFDMAYYIQNARILSGDTWEMFKFRLEDGYHPGQPLGDAVTPEQIEIKDMFWVQTLEYGYFIYHFVDRGWSPDTVGQLFLDACLEREEGKLQEKYGSEPKRKAQEYNV